MACTYRVKLESKLESIITEPWSWDFFQIVRKIHLILNESCDVGDSRHVEEERIRFKQNISLNFHPNDVARCSFKKGNEIIELSVNFFGLFGANGPMPQSFTEKVFQEIKNYKNNTLSEFLDMFHHRFLSFFYKAWSINQQTLSYEKNGNNDHYRKSLNSLIGLDYENIKRTSFLPSDAKLYYSGHLINNLGTKEKLISILTSYFNVGVKIKEYVQDCFDINEDEKFYLAQKEDSGCLGQSIIIGNCIHWINGKFRIIIGPLTFKEYIKLLPGTSGFKQLIEWVRYCIPFELNWDVQFILKSDEIPQFENNVQIGYTSWLPTSKMRGNANDLILVNPGQML
jgi:type VI secretion system protein ImpH